MLVTALNRHSVARKLIDWIHVTDPSALSLALDMVALHKACWHLTLHAACKLLHAFNYFARHYFSLRYTKNRQTQQRFDKYTALLLAYIYISGARII